MLAQFGDHRVLHELNAESVEPPADVGPRRRRQIVREGTARHQRDPKPRVCFSELRRHLDPGVPAADDQQPPASLRDAGQTGGQRHRRRMIERVRVFPRARGAICADGASEGVDQIVVSDRPDALPRLHGDLPLRRLQRGDRSPQEPDAGPAQKGRH